MQGQVEMDDARQNSFVLAQESNPKKLTIEGLAFVVTSHHISRMGVELNCLLSSVALCSSWFPFTIRTI